MSSDISFTVFKGAKGTGEIFEETYTRGPLINDEVFIAVTASGLCGTDLHYEKAGIALGHEGVGIVKSIGPNVKQFKVGDRVGWGYQHDSCGHCDQCQTGKETYCNDRQMYGLANTHQGSFGTGAVWKEDYIFHLPEGLSDEDAAPLQCGGATVANALFFYDIPSTVRVGVVGVGGLGHLAIQFASKMGCDTVVFSGTDNKREEALKLGATEFYATKGKDKLEIGRKVDVLLVTTSAVPDWNLYLPILNYNAKIFPLSVAGGNLEFPYLPLVLNGITVQGSVVAPRAVHRRMLEFAARHHIKPINMTFPLNKDGITEAIKTLADGKMRYRGVLVQPKSSRL